VVSTLKAMEVESGQMVKIVSELYAGARLPFTEVPRYWADLAELRDMVLAELWRPANAPTPRNEELIDAAKAHLLIPVSPPSGATDEVCVYA
jgi:hypothetical protein